MTTATAINASNYFAPLGTVICGTLITRELAQAYVETLVSLARKDPDAERARTAKLHAAEAMDLLVLDKLTDEQQAELDEMVCETLVDQLTRYAPPFADFSAHPGDGSDMGFWVCEDALGSAIDNDEVTLQADSSIPSGLDTEFLLSQAGTSRTLRRYPSGEALWTI